MIWLGFIIGYLFVSSVGLLLLVHKWKKAALAWKNAAQLWEKAAGTWESLA